MRGGALSKVSDVRRGRGTAHIKLMVIWPDVLNGVGTLHKI